MSEAYNVGIDPEWENVEDAAGRDISIATGKNASGEVRGRLVDGVYKWEGFTNGGTGYVIFPTAGGSASGIKMELTLPPAMLAIDDLEL